MHAHSFIPLPQAAAWPAPPEPLEPAIVAALGRMEKAGRLDGDWRDQAVFGRRILEWRECGLIKV